MNAVEASCGHIERVLGKSPAFKKVEDQLYVVKQGSSYVMISVVQTGGKKERDDRAIVRVTAQVVAGVRPEASLFRQLLILNSKLRFGAFAYVPDGSLILFAHAILGGEHMDPREIVATVHDVAIVADEYDDRIVARYGGQRMQDVVEQSAMSRLFGGDHSSEEDI
jgi:hypothetical protein